VPSSLRQSAEALSERIGADANYSSFVLPAVSEAERSAPSGRPSMLRLLWLASLALFLVVLILAALVGLGL
jgi:hypothetical protein